MLRRFFITLLACTGWWLTASSQNVLSGQVLDSLTREPVPFASVFFANTTIGTTSNDKGEFLLRDFKSGKYDVIVSFVGYQKSDKSLTFLGTTQTLMVLLKPEATQLDEVVLRPNFKQKGSDLKKFEKLFLGDNRNASFCKILNETELVAYQDEDINSLIAFARAPLEIRNDALGYKLVYELDNFEVNFNTLTQNYSGTPRFEELVPKNLAQKRKWEDERKRAYQGSFTHLIHCLREGNLNGSFILHELFQKPNPKRPPEQFLKERISFWRTKFLSNRGTTTVNTVARDSMQYYVKLYNQPQLIDSLGRKFFRPEQLLDRKRERIIYSGLLHIIYTGESEESDYIKINQGTRHGNEQHSTILIKPGGVTIYDNGYYEPLSNIFFDGYMMWSDRISNLLPREYVPGP